VRSPWHKWGSPILLLLIVGALAYGGWWGYQTLLRPLNPVDVPPCVTQSANVITPDKVTVRVYNGGTTKGRANAIASQLTTKGFTIGYVGNTNDNIVSTIVRGAHNTDPEVRLVAGFFPGATVEGDNRIDHTVDILVGDVFAGVNMNAPLQVSVPGGTVCVPVTPSASPTRTPTVSTVRPTPAPTSTVSTTGPTPTRSPTSSSTR